jgi:hypothetical protein
MKTTITVLAFLLWPTLCFAGGDYVSGNIVGITEQDGKYIIRFVQTDNTRPELMNGCKEIETTVQYSRVPWFSWLPIISSSHPSRKETDKAIEYMKKAKKDNQMIYYGYLGMGLVPTAVKCSYKSKGLRVIHDRGVTSVLSYHDQT